MVNAHLSQIQESGYVHAIFTTEEGNRFSTSMPLDLATADVQAKRQMYFINRNLMAKSLIGYLTQRRAALKHTNVLEESVELFNTIYENRMLDFHEFIKVVECSYPGFLRIIPDSKSEYYKHYKKVIEPILMFCVGLQPQAN